MTNEIVATYVIEDKHYDIYACFSKTEIDFYDVIERESGKTINEGEPFAYNEGIPTIADVKAILEIRKMLEE